MDPGLSVRNNLRSRNLLSDQVLWPEFVLHDDCIFLADGFSAEKYVYWQSYFHQLSRGKSAVESMLNNVGILECFGNTTTQVSAKMAKEAFSAVKDAWQAKLSKEFPERTFEVTFAINDPIESSEISFHENTVGSR